MFGDTRSSMLKSKKAIDSEGIEDILNEQDLADLKEIRMLEKIANIKESQGLEDEHSEFIKDSQDIINEALNLKKPEKYRPKVPYSST